MDEPTETSSQTQGQESDAETGTPLSPTGRALVALCVLAVLGFSAAMLFTSPIFKPVIATMPIPALDRPAEMPLALAPNAQVGFGMRAESFSYEGADYVTIRVELLRAGAVVATLRCHAFELEGISGSGTDVSMYNSDCQVRAPAAGADRVRITATQEGEGSLSMRGITVPMYTP